jgi:hypothetical protein
VARVRVLADEFLRLRADQLQSGQRDTVGAIERRIAAAKQQVAETSKKIAALAPTSASSGVGVVAGEPAVGSLSRADQARLTALQAERSREEGVLNGLEQAVQAYQVSNQVAVSREVAGSQVLDAPAPVHRSLVRHALLYAVAGLVAGLLLGVALVIVQALVSGRLRWRDEVARALGAPVHLSVGRLRAARWRPGRGGRDRDVQRLVAHLRGAVPARAGGTAALAVVAVDNAAEVAPSVVALAVSCAREGKQVVLADLAGGAPAARLLQIKRPATGTVRVNEARVHGVSLMVAVPSRGSAALAGPLPQARAAQPGMPGMPGPPEPPSEAVAAVYASADLLITLATLDPATGPDHLPTWADSAVVTVTAGQSSETRINAVGEMIRLAGTPLVSAVLTGTDKHDESLGAEASTPTTSGTGYGATSHGATSHGGHATTTPRPTHTPATEHPSDDTEHFEAIPTTTDTNGNHSPGEMIQLAATPHVSNVIMAGKSDESPGAAASSPDGGRGGEAVESVDAVERADDDTEDFEVVSLYGVADANGSRAPEPQGSRAVVRRLPRQGVRRLSWGVADQAVSSLTNFAVTIYVARMLGATQFGAFSLAYVTYADWGPGCLARYGGPPTR